MAIHMAFDAYITLALLLVLFVLRIKTKIPAPAIFLGALTIALTLRLAPAHELLKGFSNQGMLTVAVLFMVAAGMYATGAITMIMDKLIGLPQIRFTGAQIKILPPIAFGSAFLNNTPLVAMMIPVIRDLCRSSRLPPQQLYMPLSFASILGGMCTVIGTSTNLVIAGLVMEAVSNGNPCISGIRALKYVRSGAGGASHRRGGYRLHDPGGTVLLKREQRRQGDRRGPAPLHGGIRGT